MGKHFGNLQRLKGVTYYSLSPNELNPFQGFINPGIPNGFRKFSRIFFLAAIPFIASGVILTTAVDEFHKSQRKNPDDYKNDV